MDKETLQKKFKEIYTFIEFHSLYISNMNTISIIKNGKKIKLNRVISSIISAMINKGSVTLLSGPPGSGKTSIARFISRLLVKSSIEDTENIIHCDRELTKDEWMAFMDPSDILSGKGNWKIQWAKWTKYPIFIIDEVTRSGGNMQNALLLLMNDSKLQYAMFSKKLEDLRIIMTNNPRDETTGTIHVTPLSPAFLDRITQNIYVESPKQYAMEKFKESRLFQYSLGVSDDDLSDPQSIGDGEIIGKEGLNEAYKYSMQIPIDDDADLFARILCTYSDLCIRAPLFSKSNLGKIKQNEGLCKNCHFDASYNYGICKKISGSSMRMYKDLITMGKCYAFWIGLNKVSKELLLEISPDIISHRMYVPEWALREDADNTYGNKRKYIIKNYIRNIYKRLNQFKLAEQSYKKLIQGIGNDSDLLLLRKFGNTDIFIRIEYYANVVMHSNIFGNLLDDENAPKISCNNKEYKDFANQIRQCKDENCLLSLLSKTDVLPFNHYLKNLIFKRLKDLKSKL